MSSPIEADAILRGPWPSPLFEAFANAANPGGSVLDRLRRITDAAELVTRFVCAVLDAERARYAIQPGPQRVQLLERLHSATFGLWLSGAQENARLLRGQSRTNGFPVLLKLFEDEKTPGCIALLALKQLRNDMAHGNHAAEDGEIGLERGLRPLAELAQALRPLWKHPVVIVDSARRNQDTIEQRVYSRRGSVHRDYTLKIETTTRLVEEVAILSADDQLIPLSPWIVYNQSRAQTLSQIAVFHQRLDGKAHYEVPGLPHFQQTWRTDAPRPEVLSLSPDIADELRDPTGRADRPQIDGLEIRHLIHQGDAWTVWSATIAGDSSNQRFHLQIPHAHGAGSPRERLRQELELSRRLRSPRLVAALELKETRCGRPALLTEAPAGVTFTPASPPSPAILIEVGQQLAMLCEELHANNLTLGPLHPSNILRSPDGAIQVYRALHLHPTTQGPALPRAPELVPGANPTPATDIFTIGALLAALGAPDQATDARIAALPVGLQAVVRRATQAGPRDRYATPADLALHLRKRSVDLQAGPPAEAGVRLHTGHRLEGRLTEISPQLYHGVATDPQGNQKTLLIAHPAMVEDLERDLSRAANTARQPALLLETSPCGLRYAALPGNHSPDALLKVLTSRLAAPQQAAREAESRSRDQLLLAAAAVTGGAALASLGALGAGLLGFTLAQKQRRKG